jgi:serine/threonine protein kinase
MGTVYLTKNPTLPRHDALRVLSADLSRDRAFRERFIREADIVSQFDHPNIVRSTTAERPATASCGSRCSTSTAPTPRPPCAPGG